MKKDITRLAVERAARTVHRALERVREQVPYGPDRAAILRSELPDYIKRAGPEALRQVINQVDTQTLIDALRKVNRRG